MATAAEQIQGYFKTYLGRDATPQDIQHNLKTGQSLQYIENWIKNSDEAKAFASSQAKAAKAPTQQAPATQTNTAPVVNQMQSAVNNPTLPPGAVFNPMQMSEKPGEILNNPIYTNPTGLNQNTANTGPAATAQTPGAKPAATVDPHTIGNNAAQMEAAQGALSSNAQVQAAQGTVSEGSLVQAAQGTVEKEATIQGQLESLMKGDQTWATGATRAAEQSMAARGMGASTMAANAIAGAILDRAIPIAAQDAQTFAAMGLANLNNRQQAALQNAATIANMDLANLSNRQAAAVTNAQHFLQIDLANLNNTQQANLINQQARQQALLSDQAAINAAKQFNATSQNQVNQFYDNLAATISTFNAGQINAMQQFNTGEENAMRKFNAELSDARERFNIQNQLIVDQSNAEWRRSINTANTAAVNAANQLNAANLLNISNTAMNNIWQEYRDNASWAFTAAENQKNREYNLAAAALERDFISQQMDRSKKDAMISSVGSFVANLLI